MSKRIALVAAVVLAACGTEKAPVDPGSDAGSGAGVPVASLQSNTQTVKVILKTTSQVFTPVTQYEASTDTTTTVACSVVADCAAVGGTACQGGICGNVGPRDVVFTSANLPRTQATFQVPCDGNSYTAELIGGDTTAAPFTVTERHVATITMPNPCPATPVTPAWASTIFTVPLAAGIVPTFTVPPVYANMGAPNNFFTVVASNFGAPWASTGWTLSYTGQTGTTQVRGPLATLAAPTSNADITLRATVNLSSSLLSTGEAANAWSFSFDLPAVTPIASGGVNIP